jgi:Transcription factor zinc-finger
MYETVRQNLRRQLRHLAWFTLAAIFSVEVFFVVAHGLGHATGFVLADLFAALVLGGGATLMWRRVKCPKCRASLGETAMRTMAGLKDGRVDQCPHCGVGFDEPMPKNPISDG